MWPLDSSVTQFKKIQPRHARKRIHVYPGGLSLWNVLHYSHRVTDLSQTTFRCKSQNAQQCKAHLLFLLILIPLQSKKAEHLIFSSLQQVPTTPV